MMSDYPDSKIIENLNDFNFEGIAKSKNCIPSRRGWERTGTSAFMALELLKYRDGQLKRWYRYDLESSAWCFAYLILATDLSAWFNGTHVKIRHAKLSFAYDSSTYEIHPIWADYRIFTYAWVRKWIRLTESRNELLDTIVDKGEQIEKLTEEDSKVADAVYMKDVIDEASKLEGSTDLEVFQTANECGISITLDSAGRC